MNIGFDLDKIFIDHPPFIPDWVIDRLYKKKANGTLLYRIPGKLEQKIRILSHAPLLRPLIKKNLHFVREFSRDKKNKIFLISSRFNFLKGQTDALIQRYKFDDIFSHMYFNYKNQQPHQFKSTILSKEKIDVFIDDDLPLLKYLAKKHPAITFYWFNSMQHAKIAKNLIAISHIEQLIK
ncbi:MAG TPA: hypothetical protein VN711_03170 [Candidatus Saccharimonadales bacterium]|nr:hypothetical protein [Candidatus Saccharimonadales bacterium]